MTTQSDKEKFLSILHVHGRQFLSEFGVHAPKREASDSDGSEPESEEEWMGFSSSTNTIAFDTASGDGGDDLVGSSSCVPDVTIFRDSSSLQKRPEAGPSTREHKRSFMSSRVSNVTSCTQPTSKRKTRDGESDDECTNTRNDALLHRLVHTELLSGSLNPEVNLDHAQKERALAGRVLELAGEAKLGKGEGMFRREQHNRAAKHVRDGLIRKQRENEKRALDEAKSLGNYHPALKQHYDSNPPPRKKRARGLGMGIGKFVGGTLKLSRNEIASVTRSENSSQGNRRHIMCQRPR